MTYQCELLELQPQPTLIIRTRTPVQDLPRVLGEAYKTILDYLSEIGKMPHGAPFVAYYNMDMENLDIEVGFPVGRPLSGQETVLPGEIPGGKYAAATYTGPYHQISSAYEALTAWVQQHNYEVSGIAYEIYLNDPSNVPPDELQTQILFPLK